ncbi:MAG: DUF2384 domain-containing protein [Proteobacteria bacterium]|nr:DUF2384 domain-containing protein [Pseudomonadota bacterium]MCH8952251.1 DUF2384 domain-containing protein [Pseudomonadota bacterium]
MSSVVERPVVQFLIGLRQTGGLRGTDIANFTDVSKATVSRWTNGQKSPHPRTQLILSDLHYVVMRLSEYYNAEEIRAWLYARHPQLEGARAIDFIHEDRCEAVLNILDRLDADVYL